MTGFSKLFFGLSKTTKEASAGNAAGVHNVPSKLSYTARHLIAKRRKAKIR